MAIVTSNRITISTPCEQVAVEAGRGVGLVSTAETPLVVSKSPIFVTGGDELEVALREDHILRICGSTNIVTDIIGRGEIGCVSSLWCIASTFVPHITHCSLLFESWNTAAHSRDSRQLPSENQERAYISAANLTHLCSLVHTIPRDC